MSHRDEPGFKLYTGNRMERLVDALARVVGEPLATPLAQEVVVVANHGMERWLSLQLADRLGIWANTVFLFPNALVHDLFRRTVPELPERSLFEPEFLAWKIMDLLGPELLADACFAPIAAYLSDNRPLRRFQLALKIADVFDQYTLFRPDKILVWEQGVEDHWQARLWRRIMQGTSEPHRARLREQFSAAIISMDLEDLPERLCVFGLSALPPFHTGMLAGIATILPVHLFILSPCAEYWNDIVSEREAARIVMKRIEKHPGDALDANLHLEPGNALLAALGRYGRDFLADLRDIDGEEVALSDGGFPPTLLGAIQEDILLLHDRGASTEAPRIAIEETDRSIEVHSCHGPMREVEVLYDNLLDLFNTDPSINPSDILVMAPDIAAYAPFIRSVFDAAEERRLRIPYSLTDLPFGVESSIAEVFLALISLPLSRYQAGDVIALLEAPAVRAAFGIEETDLPLLRTWVRESGIRWGLDASTFIDLGIPALLANTWKTGCNRLLLGYALPAGSGRTFDGLAGFDNIEGAPALLAGALVDFIAKIQAFAEESNGAQSLAGWSALLLRLLDTFFAPESEAADEIDRLRTVLLALPAPGERGIRTDGTDLETMVHWLSLQLLKSGSPGPFLSGGVTFCAMIPMRSIPFRMICCLGMNDAAFPRKSFHASWDLIAAQPRRGDRSLEQEDRYLFLETLLSAREYIYISYTGHDVRDNVPAAPSIVVEELLSYIDRGFFIARPAADGKNKPPARSAVVVDHRLQPWHRAYFSNDARHFSFSPANAVAAQSRAVSGATPLPAFWMEELPLPSGELSDLDIGGFISFFKNPVRYCATRRLGISLPEQEGELDNVEKFALVGLDRYTTAEDLIDRLLNGGTAADLGALMAARGGLPPGNVGIAEFDTLAAKAASFAAMVDECRKGLVTLPLLPVNLRTGGIHLTGIIDNCYQSRRLIFRFAAGSPKDYLALWIPHLVLNAFAPPGYPKESFFVGKNKRLRLCSVPDAKKILERLAALYTQGLRSPLLFFPRSSFTFAERSVVKGVPRDEAMARAQEIWTGSAFASGERDDPYYGYCLGPTFVFNEACANPAMEVWAPFFKCLKESEGLLQ